MDKEEQVEHIAAMLAHINVPASDGYPEVNMVFMGPVLRIANWMYEQGMRWEPPHVD